MKWEDFLTYELNKRKLGFLFRKREVIKNNINRFIYIKNKKYINFSSNDYFGFSINKNIIKSFKKGIDKYGVGSGSSGHIIGYTEIHKKLEKSLANWLGYEESLLFNSGYSANQSIISTLMKKGDFIFADKLIHASLIEASFFSRANLKRFLHNDLKSLKYMLSKHVVRKSLIVTEGIFSMEGDSAPIKEIKKISRDFNSWMLVDDSHGIGVIGEEGRGSCFLHNVKPELLMITFSKSIGINGAALLCSRQVKEYFIQYSKNLIYSTSMIPAQAFAILESVKHIKKADNFRKKLKDNVKYFRKISEKYNLPLLNSLSQIQLIPIKNDFLCLEIFEFLKENGFLVQAIRYPTVPIGTPRIRITLLSSHSFIDIEHLIELIYNFFNRHVS
ncbi:8-amino-7-oxononanoate synthase [Candidatus Riesia sp. GBBU]|nr:8-amino-7-oxononanoate synthase [Candidatus Riesia sp. GBBU]ARC55058.1 8-amino-7-oxononanoate synthase [Candidatus Riesia sp. GBBU]